MTKRILAILSLGLALNSCGGSEGGLDGASGSITAGGMGAVLGAGEFTSIINSFSVNNTVSLPISFPAGVGLTGRGEFDACTTETGDNTVDADSDQIPKSFKQEYKCTAVAGNPGTLSREGYFQVTDKDDTKASLIGGFTYDFEFFSIYDAPHEYNEARYSGLFDITTSGNRTTMIHKYKLANYNEARTGNALTSSFDLQTDWSQSYIADDAANPWTKGEMKLEGYFRFTGDVVYNSVLYPIDVTWEISTTNLMYDRNSCPFFKSGSMTFTDGAGNTLKYEYNNCTLTRSFNGTTI